MRSGTTSRVMRLGLARLLAVLVLTATPLGDGRSRLDPLRAQFDQAAVLLQARRHGEALTVLHRVLQLQPRLPEAHVNLGYALLGLQRAAAARQAFRTAIDLRPQQANAYYGLAIAEEQAGDLPAALGAMRSYLHLSRTDDAHRARARAALWEWEARLGRH